LGSSPCGFRARGARFRALADFREVVVSAHLIARRELAEDVALADAIHSRAASDCERHGFPLATVHSECASRREA
jgi:hypothetical protein